MESTYEVVTDKIEVMEGVAWRCIHNVHYFNLISKSKFGGFWTQMQNVVGESVCLSWAHLFGNYSDSLHIKNFFELPVVIALGEKYQRKNIQERLWDSIDMGEEEYALFRNEVKNCRDKFIAHKDLPEAGIIFPRIDLCRLQVEELRSIFSEIISLLYEKLPKNLDVIGLKKYYDSYPNTNFETSCHNSFELGVKQMAKSLAKVY